VMMTSGFYVISPIQFTGKNTTITTQSKQT
jgi:hypothetical protein